MANREKQAEVLRRTQAKRKEQKKEQVLKAIAEIQKQKKPLTFKNIATIAGCSISYLYKWDEIKAYIHELQQQNQNTLNPIEEDNKDRPHSIKTLHEVAKQRIRDLEATIKDLKHQNEKLRGHVAEIYELRNENERLRTQLRELINPTLSSKVIPIQTSTKKNARRDTRGESLSNLAKPGDGVDAPFGGQMTDNNLPPTNIEAEEAILGSILFDSGAIGIAASILPIEAFYVAAHQQIYKAALELHNQDKLTDFMGVSTWLKDHRLLKGAGGTAKLAKLLNQTLSATNIDRYIALVLEKYQRRQLIVVANDLQDLAYDNAIELETVFNTSEEKIFNLTTNKQDKFKPLPIGDCLASVFEKIEQGSSPAYPTGLEDLDALIGGLIKQDLIIIAARASMGKTWLACHLANHIATEQQKSVVFLSAEMSSEQLTKRFLSMHTGIDSHRLMHNQIYEDEYDVLVTGLTKLAELPIIIDDTPATQLTPSKVRSVLRSICSEKGELGLVVLDYIQKLGDRACRNRAQTVGKFSGAFKDIAKEFDVPFVALAQINRGVESIANKRPLMSDIKDSGDIEQDMDLGLMLYRDEYYNPDTTESGIMEIIVGKNRNGSTGSCHIQFDPSIGKFVSL